MEQLLVGLTGGLASGKSTVARMLRERGVPVLDADEVVVWLYRPGGDGTARVREHFGPEYLAANGSVNRPALADLVFSNPEARKRLEQLIHPLVRDRFRQFAGGREGIVVYEATLLVESGGHGSMDVLVTVEADTARRLDRAMARGAEQVAAKRRIAAQSPGSVRESAADYVIRNDGSIEDLERQVAALFKDLEHRLASKEAQRLEDSEASADVSREQIP